MTPFLICALSCDHLNDISGVTGTPLAGVPISFWSDDADGLRQKGDGHYIHYDSLPSRHEIICAL